jgi:hypothetical protein
MAHKSSNSKSFGEVVKHWGLLSSGLADNAIDLAHLEGHRIELQSIVTQALGLLTEQKIQTASKQDLSRRVEDLVDQGSKIASFLRLGVKTRYGTRSEKLVEFDLLPFRGKARAVKPAVVNLVNKPVKPPVTEAAQEQEDAPADE